MRVVCASCVGLSCPLRVVWPFRVLGHFPCPRCVICVLKNLCVLGAFRVLGASPVLIVSVLYGHGFLGPSEPCAPHLCASSLCSIGSLASLFRSPEVPYVPCMRYVGGGPVI